MEDLAEGSSTLVLELRHFYPTVFLTLALMHDCPKEEGIHRKPEPRDEVGCLPQY